MSEVINILTVNAEALAPAPLVKQLDKSVMTDCQNSNSDDDGVSDAWFCKHGHIYHLEGRAQLCVAYQMSEEELVKVIEIVDVFIELYVLFGLTRPRSQTWFRKNGSNTSKEKRASIFRSNQVRYKTIHILLKFVQINGEGSWVKLIKFKTAAFFAFYRGQELPVRPEYKVNEPEDRLNAFYMPYNLLGGSCISFLERLRNRDDNKFMQFVDSALYLKKGMPTVPQSMIQKGIDDTVQELTGVPRVDPDLVVETPTCWETLQFCSKEQVINALRRTTRELYSGHTITAVDLYEPFFPSTSANYNWSRDDGGALSELYMQGFLGEGGSQLEFGYQTCSLFGRKAPHYGELGRSEQYRYSMESQLNYEPYEAETTLILDPTVLKDKWRDTYRKIWDASQAETPYVMGVGLAEPLKVRVISKGPPLLYTALKPLQKWLWSILKKNDVFALISRMVTEEDVNRVCFGMPQGHIALSGDYVSSTNRLHSWVSETILDELMEVLQWNINPADLMDLPPKFFEDLKSMFLKALTKHVFVTHHKITPEEAVTLAADRVYSVEKCKGTSTYHQWFRKDYHPQTEGQLMGSIISFPFLCIANAALCRLSLETASGRTFRLTNKAYPASGPIAPLLVNGDDCLLSGDKSLRPLWEAFCSIAGLASSVGKTYFSDKFCTINSVIYEKDTRSGLWSERKYINIGLLLGKSQKGQQQESVPAPIYQLGARCRDLKKMCPESLWLKTKKRFLYYNMNQLKKYPSLPWFIPEWLGGIGLPKDHESEITELNRKMATIIRNNYRDKKFKPVMPKDMPKWLMHKVVMENERKLGMDSCLFTSGYDDQERVSFDLESEYARLYKYQTVDLLYSYDYSEFSQEVIAVNADKQIKKALHHNEKVQYNALKVLHQMEGSVPIMSDSDMSHENKSLVLPCRVKPINDFQSLASDSCDLSLKTSFDEDWLHSLLNLMVVPSGWAKQIEMPLEYIPNVMNVNKPEVREGQEGKPVKILT